MSDSSPHISGRQFVKDFLYEALTSRFPAPLELSFESLINHPEQYRLAVVIRCPRAHEDKLVASLRAALPALLPSGITADQLSDKFVNPLIIKKPRQKHGQIVSGQNLDEVIPTEIILNGYNLFHIVGRIPEAEARNKCEAFAMAAADKYKELMAAPSSPEAPTQPGRIGGSGGAGRG